MNWTSENRDLFIDLVLSGAKPEALANRFKLRVFDVKDLFQRAFYSNDDYIPYRRIPRTGKPLTELETNLITKCYKKGIPVSTIAKLLARKPEEIPPAKAPPITDKAFAMMKAVAPVTDQLLAYHYLYHVSKNPIISDKTYNDAKAEEIEFGGGGWWLHLISKSRKRVVDYPPHIRSLAYYMLYKFMEGAGKWDETKLPYSWGAEKAKNAEGN